MDVDELLLRESMDVIGRALPPLLMSRASVGEFHASQHTRETIRHLKVCKPALLQKIEPMSIGCGLWRTGKVARRGRQPDRASCCRSVWVPKGHECNKQPVAPGVGGQPQRARAVGEHGGGGRAHQDLHALVAALAPRRGRWLGHPGPLQGALSPSAAAPATHQPALHAAIVGCSMAATGNQIGSPLALPQSAGQTGACGRCGAQMRMLRQGQAGSLKGSISPKPCACSPCSGHGLMMRVFLRRDAAFQAAGEKCLCSDITSPRVRVDLMSHLDSGLHFHWAGSTS